MPVETHAIESREQWLALRKAKADITASTCAAVLGLHERITPLQLWMHHAKIVPFEDGVDTPPMRRGRLMESVALECIKELHPDWDVWPARDYVRDPVKRLGATPDAYVRDTFKHLGVVEIKSVEPYVFERTWRDESGGITPPMAALLQVSLAAHLCQAMAYIGVLRVGHGVDFDLLEIPHTPGLIERLEQAAAAFWQSIDKKEPPPPDFLADADLVMRMHAKAEPGKAIDLSADNELADLRDRYVQAAEKAKSAEEQKKAIKAQLLHKMGDAAIAMVHGEVFATANVVKMPERKQKAYEFRKLHFKGTAA
jgi:predicted phage-related endonuclease